MCCTRLLPFLFLALGACSMVTPRDQDVSEQSGNGILNSYADEDVAAYRSAITALNNSQLDRAQTEFRKIIEKRPGLAGPWLNLALIDYKKNDFEEARRNITQALSRNSKMAPAFNLRGSIELAQGNITRAADDYRKSIAMRENYPLAHYNLALVYDIYFQDLKNSIRHYKRYLELTDNQDKKTVEWVAELERNLAKAKP